MLITMPWHTPAKIKRGGHFGVLTGMWVYQKITLQGGQPTLQNHRPKLGLRSTSSNAITITELSIIDCLAFLSSTIRIILIACWDNNNRHEKILDSDWQNSREKSSVTPVQITIVILNYDLLKDNGKFSKPMISSGKTMTKILYGNFESSQMQRNGFNKGLPALSPCIFSSCLYY